MPSYELPLPDGGQSPSVEAGADKAEPLSKPLLIANMLWFCRIRWMVAGTFTAFGLASLFPDLVVRFGLRHHIWWPFVVAAALVLANLGFLAHARGLAERSESAHIKRALWAQIAYDLLIVTVFAYFAGSRETYAVFVYLFHIVLACVFFSRSESLAVTVVACALYVAVVALEEVGILPATGIYADNSFSEHLRGSPQVSLINAVSALTVMTVVWYLSSQLSDMVRDRENELTETNRRLVAAQKERTRHMLHTTHELKSPFAAIQANTQVLLKGYCGVLPERAHEIVSRIAARCRALTTGITDMLQLANLQSSGAAPLRPHVLDLARALEWSVDQVRPMAEERGVTIESDIAPARGVAVEDHIKMLFGNVLSNAVRYSRDGGRIRVLCAQASKDGAVVSVEDQGLGIPQEKLPRIFDEYYRTEEAARHNEQSTGLGLAIVRRVAQAHGIRLRVESSPGIGTKFEMRFPALGGHAQGDVEEKEKGHGVRVDH